MTSHRYTATGSEYVCRPDPGRTRHTGAVWHRPTLLERWGIVTTEARAAGCTPFWQIALAGTLGLAGLVAVVVGVGSLVS